MSRALESLVAFYVTKSPKADEVDGGTLFNTEKALERKVIEEVVLERADEIDAEVKRREDERAAARELGEFQSVLFQCVTLALLVGVLGSHLYGLLEALIYQPEAQMNILPMIAGLVILVVVTGVALFKVYIRKLFDSTKKLRESRRGAGR